VSIPKSSAIVRQTQPVDFYTILKNRVGTRRNNGEEAVFAHYLS